jgi:15-cis-phytoene synthase
MTEDDPEDLDAIVRRADPDRWTATRFINDAQARRDVIALYAFNDEIARVAPAVSNPMLGEIRFAWWSEALDEIYAASAARRHPVVEALAEAVRRTRPPRALFDALIEARHADLDGAPFADEAQLFAYLDAASGGLMALGAAMLGAPHAAPAVRGAARAWGVAGFARSHWGGAPNRLPSDWDASRVRASVSAALAEARSEMRQLPVQAFPAVAYAALAEPYARKRLPSPLSKQTRMLWAVARGTL